jgi:hypothetical protein
MDQIVAAVATIAAMEVNARRDRFDQHTRILVGNFPTQAASRSSHFALLSIKLSVTDQELQ